MWHNIPLNMRQKLKNKNLKGKKFATKKLLCVTGLVLVFTQFYCDNIQLTSNDIIEGNSRYGFLIVCYILMINLFFGTVE